MARTMSVPCRRDLACYRNDGHPGECMYPTPDTEPQPVRAVPEAGSREGLRAAYLAGVRRGTSDGMEGYPMVADDYLAALGDTQEPRPEQVNLAGARLADLRSYLFAYHNGDTTAGDVVDATDNLIDALDGGQVTPRHLRETFGLPPLDSVREAEDDMARALFRAQLAHDSEESR